MVLNAKLERPLDSHAPQTASNYVYEDDDWGDQEQSYDQERGYDEEQDVWDTEYQDQEDGTQDEFEANWDKMVEQQEAECNMTHQSSQDSDDQDEDDQDAYE